MRVFVETIVRIVIRVELSPGLAVVCAFQQSSLLDADVDGARIAGIERDILGVCEMRRRGERPTLDARYLAQPGQLLPAFAVVVAAVKVRGLCSSKENDI